MGFVLVLVMLLLAFLCGRLQVTCVRLQERMRLFEEEQNRFASILFAHSTVAGNDRSEG